VLHLGLSQEAALLHLELRAAEIPSQEAVLLHLELLAAEFAGSLEDLIRNRCCHYYYYYYYYYYHYYYHRYQYCYFSGAEHP
jgi:hypothetical protein